MHQLISLSSQTDVPITQDQVNLDLDHMTFFNQYAPYQSEALSSGFLKAQQLVPIPWILFPLCMWKCSLTIKTQPRVLLLSFYNLTSNASKSSPVTIIQDFLKKNSRLSFQVLKEMHHRDPVPLSVISFISLVVFLCLIQANLKLSNICSTKVQLHLLTWWFKQWEAPVCSTQLVKMY